VGGGGGGGRRGGGGGGGGGGLVHPESENSMAMYGLAVKILSRAISLILSAIVT